LQNLIGTTPLPPAWALGYHQCRWGYESAADLNDLDAKFCQHGIPADGLWLDIDYMDHYKVFTFAKKHFSNPGRAFTKLAKAGRKVVPIIDPGVKREPGYGVYERGKSADAFCKNPQGNEYVGLVWPGETVFPDFSLESACAWWAKEVEDFARLGIYGAWLDMNDPATGGVENSDMLFQHGLKSHSSYHNQYALGMAAASRQGFLQAHPNLRPFLLSRSGCIGSSRYTAIWTGDNHSNYFHLKNSISTTLNLALSGVPFCAPDAGGFGGDTTPELISDWFKAGFLFPFFRNHSANNTRKQEPWALGKETLSLLRRFIQLRYRLRPYLYQLFIRHEREGEAILRPLFYDFQDTPKLPIGLVDDQFMVGPSVMQAPFLEEKQTSREVILPGANRWYDLSEDRWLEGGRKITVQALPVETPIYIRDNSILPLARIRPHEHRFFGELIDFRIFLSENGTASVRYTFDDGVTFAYQSGKRSEVEIVAKRTGTMLAINVTSLSDGFGSGDFTFTADTEIKTILVNSVNAKRCPAQGLSLGRGKTATWTCSSFLSGFTQDL
jgi:alpha-glucosidase